MEDGGWRVEGGGWRVEGGGVGNLGVEGANGCRSVGLLEHFHVHRRAQVDRADEEVGEPCVWQGKLRDGDQTTSTCRPVLHAGMRACAEGE